MYYCASRGHVGNSNRFSSRFTFFHPDAHPPLRAFGHYTPLTAARHIECSTHEQHAKRPNPGNAVAKSRDQRKKARMKGKRRKNVGGYRHCSYCKVIQLRCLCRTIEHYCPMTRQGCTDKCGCYRSIASVQYLLSCRYCNHRQLSYMNEILTAQ